MCNLVQEFGLNDVVRAAQSFCDTYGVYAEGIEEQHTKDLFGLTTYIIKFSIPDTWENGVLHTPCTSNDIINQFKTELSSVFVKIWSDRIEDFTDEDAKAVLNYLKFKCRVRDGEIWTKAKKDEAAKTTNEIIKNAIDEKRKEESYVDV